MLHNPIIPAHLTSKLAPAALALSTSELVELGQEFYQWLIDNFHKYEITALVHARADFVDQVLQKVWCQHHLDEHQISLLAVGGYGRGELHPHSDVDILILTQSKISKELEHYIAAFITELWDIRLDIGHSVRSVKECVTRAKADVTIATNLLESRLICGNTMLEEQLRPHLNKKEFWPSDKFFIAKRDEQKQRHQQYRGAAYTLEPNLKANPGGLRDIQTISWVAKRHFLANTIQQLVEHDYLSDNELAELIECQDYLWRMRFCLHIVAGRSENRLLFDYQGDVANMMGFGDDGKPAVERMMKRFFRIINSINELNEMLLQHFEQGILGKDQHVTPVDIDKHFEQVGTLIRVKNRRGFIRHSMFLKLFIAIADNPKIKGIHSQTIRNMRNTRRRLIGGLNDYATCRTLFMELMRHPNGLGRAFNLMHRHEILANYLPEWQSIVGQMQFDLFHAYSVDEHSYRLIKNLYRFSLPEHNHEFPLCSTIAQKIRKPELLYIAGIFHDIAKGRGGDHSKLGAVDALAFGKVHKMSEHDSRLVAWLVQHHLLMSVTAQRKDISDPEVIAKFASVVRDENRLDYLYCLTVADMRATNESLWNSWKSNLLQELYFATKAAFRRGLEKPVELRTKIRENRQKGLEKLAEQGIDVESVKTLWKQLKPDYFLRYTPTQQAWHARHILSHDKQKPLVIISEKPYRGGTEVFVYTKDESNIFATIVSVLSAKKLSIHDAKIMTSKDGYTLNTFVVLDGKGHPLKDLFYLDNIKTTLNQYLTEGEAIDVSNKPIPSKLKQFKVRTKISFIKHNNPNVCSIEVVAMDRPGLLADIGQVFQECDVIVHTAKISTYGERVEDIFIVSNKNEQALSIDEQNQLESRLCEMA
ncbi:[protein-PII] uridylyltransferase [Thalassotalea sp. HSM 43]|uniref:[protein-PII] uridylyltransferase n=1 Tax=Thalassotalea sp. HSM 43 TaxID=2552945 RepID=UPI00107FFC8B|nr:[protein-PII] uridylyltransferase [Thalassotalea sp. HSM 43]QBY05526.1 [protein-PII] uridylyltransferase [Thalassotalea sp. HSM 43]